MTYSTTYTLFLPLISYQYHLTDIILFWSWYGKKLSRIKLMNFKTHILESCLIHQLTITYYFEHTDDGTTLKFLCHNL